jgi:hypothetical protein
MTLMVSSASVVEVDSDGVDSSENPMDCAIVEIQKAKGSSMARLTFDVGDVKHVIQAQNVGVEMHPVDPVCDSVAEVRQISIAHILTDLDLAQRKLCDLLVDPFACAILKG